MVHQSPKQAFSSGSDYRNHLILQGYKDLGWINGWNDDDCQLWTKQTTLEDTVDHTQWNRSGSDCTFVLHQNKVFCSVDMGD